MQIFDTILDALGNRLEIETFHQSLQIFNKSQRFKSQKSVLQIKLKPQTYITYPKMLLIKREGESGVKSCSLLPHTFLDTE